MWLSPGLRPITVSFCTQRTDGKSAAGRPGGASFRGLVEKTGVNVDDIEDLILGCAFPQGEQGFNMARLVALLAGLPITVAGRQSIGSVVHQCNPFTMRARGDPDGCRGSLYLRRR
ncbi:MAG: hypothetical protein Ct9H300mP16_08210 [Pseudomonadota bacterium]|nr:MAG: hypothetical protein Ct9H300mP16_08210 [Pseudomonadota bacterium]